MMGCVPDAHMAMEQLRGNEMHFAVLPLVHPRARREFRQKTSREEPFTRSDLTLSSVKPPPPPPPFTLIPQEDFSTSLALPLLALHVSDRERHDTQHAWSNNVVGSLSPWLNLDSPNARVRNDSERALRQEVMWAQACLPPIPPPSQSKKFRLFFIAPGLK